MELSKTIGGNLKAARRAKGLTQREVAEKMFMTQQQYSRFENGVCELNYEQLRALCRLVDTTPNELYGVDD